MFAATAAAQDRSGPATPSEAADGVRAMVSGFADEARRLQRAVDRLERREPAQRVQPSLSEGEVLAIADTSDEAREWIDDHPVTRTTSEFDEKERKHTVWYVAKRDDGTEDTEAQVFISDETGEITEVRTGPQVAWMMARGYEGAFGRAINRPVVWLTLCALFLVPLIQIRRFVSWRTFDLLALLSFSLSLHWFNQGEIFTSVPLAYPPMAYFAVRLGWIGFSRTRRAPVARPADPPPPPGRPRFAGWSPTWLLFTALGIALALRYGLNAFDSNVIDVGYAGVIGADLIADGRTPYGTFPEDCGRCDTYGPLNYLMYIPFELAMPWGGTWDALPSAHGAATLFDILCVAGMLVLGWSLGGMRLGAALALAWAAFPFSGYTLASNANDALVAACLIWGLVFLSRPLLRGLMLGLAVGTKFGPAILFFLWSRAPFPRPRREDRGWRGFGRYAAGLGIAGALLGWVLLLDGTDGVRAFWSRTIAYQFGRESPFSIWGQYPGLRPVQLALTAAIVVVAILVVRWPRRLDTLSVACLSGLLVIGPQLTLTHWFYLYIPWFLPFVLLAVVPDWPAPAPRPAPPPPPLPEGDVVMGRDEPAEEATAGGRDTGPVAGDGAPPREPAPVAT